jgi:uracil-DNA glycosylase
MEARAAALAELQDRIRACRRCQEQGYLQQAQPIIAGRISDRMMVIGQAPGRRSLLRGIPFGGPGGRVLQGWLEQAGFPAGYLHRNVPPGTTGFLQGRKAAPCLLSAGG